MAQINQYIKNSNSSSSAKGKFIRGKSWNRIFQSSAKEVNHSIDDNFVEEQIKIDEVVWQQIMHSLPKGYILPNLATLELLATMKASSYDYLFHNHFPTPHMYVDRYYWDKIVINLPKDYLLPTPLFEKIIKPMNSRYYDSLFSNTLGTTDFFVDNRILEKIKKNLPDTYMLPNPQSNILLHPPEDNNSPYE
ncbi:hypothetical protein [Psychrobacillus sp. L3]|uniref:hypothetical protein n=1 Tax=Psychrobacillus sp. L3 TaxID=3236891 RepID=UPI0036F3B9FB